MLLGYQAHPSPIVLRSNRRTTGLRINAQASRPRGLYQPGILLFKDGEVPLRFPVPYTIGCKDEIHFFERALVGLQYEWLANVRTLVSAEQIRLTSG